MGPLRAAALSLTLSLTSLSLASLALSALVALSGCSDSPRAQRDGSVDRQPMITPSDAPSDRPANETPPQPGDALPADAGDDGAPGEAGRTIPKTGLPLPADVPPPRRIAGSNAELVGSGKTSCTHQEPASGNGDRWCAFSLPSGEPEFAQLWVINVTGAAAGQVPPCDGTSDACLKLTDRLDPMSANAFDGDTLIFYTESITDPSGELVGPVSAWRPGWSQARAIAPATGIYCRGHAATAAASCLVKPSDDPISVEGGYVLVGLLEDQTAGLLPILTAGAGSPEPLIINRETTWQMGFSPDGETFALSIAATRDAEYRMYVTATRDAATAGPHEIIQDVRFWNISSDGRKLYFARTPPGDNGGTLHLADFPGGGAVTTLTSRLHSYILLGDGTQQSVGYLTHVDGGGTTFHLLNDRELPASALTVFSHQGTPGGVLVSPDLRYTAWLDDQFHATVVRHADLATCAINTTDQRLVFLPMFMHSAGLLFWTEPAQDDDSRRDAFLAPPDRCTEPRRFAQGINFYTAVGDRGIILGDERDSFETVTVKYAAVADSGTTWPAEGPVRVQERVKPPIALVGSQPLLLVFKVIGDGQQEGGLYLFGPVPF